VESLPKKPQPAEERPRPTLLDLDLEDVDVTLHRVQSLLGRLQKASGEEIRYRCLMKQFEEEAPRYTGREVRWKLPVIVARDDRIILEDRYPKTMLGRLWSGLFISTSPHARAALPPGLRVPVSMPLRLKRGELCGIRARVVEVILGGAEDPVNMLTAHVQVVLLDVQVGP
jgi:hypothetical protein